MIILIDVLTLARFHAKTLHTFIQNIVANSIHFDNYSFDFRSENIVENQANFSKVSWHSVRFHVYSRSKVLRRVDEAQF